MQSHGHPDPLDPAISSPRSGAWGPLRRDAFTSRQMEAFREGLRLPGMPDVRSSVLDDLSTYFRVDAEEALFRATHSFDESVAEWKARPRATAADITDFYVNLRSWSFGQVWYAYLQAEGYATPVAAIIARDMEGSTPGSLLDFGSGCGAGAMMFALLGHAVTLADISTPLLSFAKFRFERRGLAATFIDLNTQSLPDTAFEVVAAIQTLAHVPDLRVTGHELHGALRAGGLLYADIDVHEREEGDSRLYADDLRPRRTLRATGFAEERSIEGVTARYRSVTPAGLGHGCRRLRDAVVLGPPRRAWRTVRYR